MVVECGQVGGEAVAVGAGVARTRKSGTSASERVVASTGIAVDCPRA